MRRHALAWLPVALWCGLIFWASSQPGSTVAPMLPALEHVDKLAHAGVYAVLGYLLHRAFARHDLGARAAFVATLVVGVLYGVSDELHQLLGGEGRDADALDLAADTVGIVIGALLWRLNARRRTA